MRVKVPFGIGQTGKSFRNEITPGNFTFRTREFEQMELELHRYRWLFHHELFLLKVILLL